MTVAQTKEMNGAEKQAKKMTVAPTREADEAEKKAEKATKRA